MARVALTQTRQRRSEVSSVGGIDESLVRGVQTLSGWGRVPVVPGREVRSEDLATTTANLPLTRGLARAYGDAALPAPGDYRVAGSVLADRLLSFDDATGVLLAEAGVSLAQLYQVFLPRGWFTPVSPGTRFVTLGGMVASDVHGKNHHRAGCFGEHVQAITLRTADGSIVRCSPAMHADLFFATIGGMGLTGHILEVAVRLEQVPSPWIAQDSERVDDIDGLVARLKDASATWPMTAGWFDGLSRGRSFGRGILFRGRWAEAQDAPRRFPALRAPVPVPVTLPDGLLSDPLMRLANAGQFFTHQPRHRRQVVHPGTFYYPLDAAGAWHRLYGPRGFVQYQCVLPAAASPDVVRRFLELVARHGPSPYLCVIKDCGAEGSGILSFPKAGMSLALDFPMRTHTQALTDRMNEFVIAEGGRVYLAKDALTRPEHFRAMEPRLDRFLTIRRQWDPQGRLRSAQSVRLFGW